MKLVMMICSSGVIISKMGSSSLTGLNVNNKHTNKPAWINWIWIKDDDFVLLYPSSLAFSSDNKFAGQKRKHNSPSYIYIKYIYINIYIKKSYDNQPIA